MELWIRSQDKRHLIKADYVSIMENNIINVASSGWDYDVAKYKSKERALEVLDEIQDILKPQLIITHTNRCAIIDEIGEIHYGTSEPYMDEEIKQLSTYVYKMPEQ